MDKSDFLKGMYEDFFGINKLSKENQDLAKEIEALNQDFPKIEVKPIEKKELSKEDKDEKMKELFDRIDNLYVEDKSKETLKKIVEYVRKYDEKIEKQYISFDMCIFTDNKETKEEVVDIINELFKTFTYTKTSGVKEVSLYDLEKVEDLSDIYKSQTGIIMFKDFEAFDNLEKSIKEAFLFKLNENALKYENEKITIIYSKTKERISELFSGDDLLKNRFFDFEIIGINPDVQDVYEEVLNKLKENMEVSEELQIKLLDYISITYPNTTLSFPHYRDDLYEKVIFNKDVPEYEKDKTMDEIFAELNELVGLEKVKKMLRELVSLIDLKSKTEGDLNIKNINLHMVFLGNPGTGKTTVARIVAQILYNLKYIKQNKLIEVSSKDLVAEYVGQTAPKTMAVVEKALGGVLFVDEAYSLATGAGVGNSYNEEAIATLIQAMENYRDNLVVIFAGYTKEMQNFLDANSGIVSRIGYTVEFEDYTTEELLKIFDQMMKKAGFTVSKEAKEEAKDVIERCKNSKNFGNARFVRNLYEKTIVKHAANTKDTKNKKELKTIKKEDINVENLIVE